MCENTNLQHEIYLVGKKIRVKEIRFALWRILINKATLYTKKEYNITIVLWYLYNITCIYKKVFTKRTCPGDVNLIFFSVDRGINERKTRLQQF